MKKLLTVFAVLMISSALAFAGPLLGVSFVPDKDSHGELTVGFNVGSINIEVQKEYLEDMAGEWAFGLLWVPQQGNFGYRAGLRLVLDYEDPGFKYGGFEFVVGVSNTWGPIQLYFDANVNSAQALGIVPVVGINILFSELIPDAAI